MLITTEKSENLFIKNEYIKKINQFMEKIDNDLTDLKMRKLSQDNV